MCPFNGQDLDDMNDIIVRIDGIDCRKRACNVHPVNDPVFAGAKFLFAPCSGFSLNVLI